MRALFASCFVSLLAAAEAWATPPLCGPADDPCVVTQSLTLPGGSSFSLGARAFVLAAGRSITVEGDGSLRIVARTITLEENAKIIALGPSGVEETGGYVELDAKGDVTLGDGSILDVSNWYAGSLTVRADGAIRLLGLLRGTATSRDGWGAYVTLDTSDSDDAPILIAGDGVEVSGGNRYGGHGTLDVIAGGDLDVVAPVDARGGEGGGDGLFLVARGDITVGPAADLDASEVGPGSGGWISMNSERRISVDGRMLVTGGGDGGYAGEIDLYAWEGVVVRGDVDASGTSLYGGAGRISFATEAGDVVVDAHVVARSSSEGEGAELSLDSRSDILFSGTADLSGAFGYAEVNATAEGRIRVEGSIVATGAYEPAAVWLLGCDVELPAGSSIDARGGQSFSPNESTIVAGGIVTIGGTLRFSRPLRTIYRDTPPVVLPSAVITPSLLLEQQSDIPCCHCAPVCGDGRLDTGEGCDDGNVLDGDCCGATCQPEAAGGTCDDGRTCTTGDVCAANGTCAGAPVVCDACERCDEGVGCVVGPKAGCSRIVVARGGQLDVKDRIPDSGDALLWQWRRGAATPLAKFGDPLARDDYALCMWNAPGALLLRAGAGHGGSCRGKPCWKRIANRGWNYRNTDATPDGIFKMKLLAGAAGKASIQVNGRGGGLPMPALGGVAMPLTVQLQGSHGACWESKHSTPSVNTAAQLKAKSD